MAEVFSYSNYRRFLRDYFSEEKKNKKNFSYAYFAQKAGFKSRTFIYKVITGEKSLPRASVYQVASALRLKKKELDYFENLVFFNEARTIEEKNYYFKKMTSSHKTNKAVLLGRDKFEYFSKWYYPSLREVVTFRNFKGDFKLLGKMLDPPITTKQAKDGIDLLLRLGLINKKNGRYVQTNSTVTTGDEIQSLAVQNFHRENLKLASKAIDACPKAKRDISSVTFGTSREGFEEIKSEIQRFRKKILQLVETQNHNDRVYQFNFQLFPQTPSKKESSK